VFIRDFAEFIISIFTFICNLPVIVEYILQSFIFIYITLEEFLVFINEGLTTIGGFFDVFLEILMWLLGIFALA